MLEDVKRVAQKYIEDDLGKHFEGETPVKLIGTVILKRTFIPAAITLHEAEFGRFTIHLVHYAKWTVVAEGDEDDFFDEGGQIEQV